MKKLLLTGASGFVGRNILSILARDYRVFTLGRGEKNDYSSDLSREIPKFKEEFEIVYHAAGKAHSLPRTGEDEKAFFDVNLTGTRNLCAGLGRSGIPKAFVFVSTVAVYGCEFGENISEEHPLAGTSPYAKSKIEAERFLQEWCAENNVVLTILRPSLIAGAEAPGNLGAMVRGMRDGRYLRIGKGSARKSIVMVEDLARIVPHVLADGGIFNVCATYAPSFAELEKLIASQLGKGEPVSIPFWLAKIMACVGDFCLGRAPIDSVRLKKITGTLTFSNAKVRAQTGWEPLPVLENYNIYITPPPNYEA